MLRISEMPRQTYLLALALFPASAYADNWAGMASLVFLLFVGIPAAFLNLVLVLVFRFLGKYKSRKFANVHSIVGAIVPVLGILLAILDSNIGWFVVYIFGLWFSLLPLYFYRRYQCSNAV